MFLKHLSSFENDIKTSLSHFRIWGCPAHVLETNSKKLEPRSRLCQFVGYPKRNERWSYEIIWDHKSLSKLVLNKATVESTRVVDEPGPLSKVDGTNTSSQSRPSQSLSMPQRSERIVSQPNCYLNCINKRCTSQEKVKLLLTISLRVVFELATWRDELVRWYMLSVEVTL